MIQDRTLDTPSSRSEHETPVNTEASCSQTSRRHQNVTGPSEMQRNLDGAVPLQTLKHAQMPASVGLLFVTLDFFPQVHLNCHDACLRLSL